MRIGGWVKVTIDGRQQVLGGEIGEFVPGGVVREIVEDASGNPAGYLEKNKGGTLKLTFVHRPDGPTIRDVQKWSGVPAAVELANGRRYVTDSLYTASVTAVNAQAGTYEAEFFCMAPMEEL